MRRQWWRKSAQCSRLCLETTMKATRWVFIVLLVFNFFFFVFKPSFLFFLLNEESRQQWSYGHKIHFKHPWTKLKKGRTLQRGKITFKAPLLFICCFSWTCCSSSVTFLCSYCHLPFNQQSRSRLDWVLASQMWLLSSTNTFFFFQIPFEDYQHGNRNRDVAHKWSPPWKLKQIISNSWYSCKL